MISVFLLVVCGILCILLLCVIMFFLVGNKGISKKNVVIVIM